MLPFTDRWDPSASPLEIYQRDFSRDHWFNQRASLLWNSSSLRNYAKTTVRTVPTFESGSVYWEGFKGGRVAYKSTANDGKGVSFGTYAPCQTGTGTWVFMFSVPSLAVASNLYLTAGLLEAVGLQIRISTSGKVELVRINTVVFHSGATTLVAGRIYTVAISYNESSGVGAIFLDGRFDSDIATARAFAHGTIRLMSNNYTVEDGAMRMYLAAVSPYESTKEQLASLSRDPLQLLEPYPWWMFAMDAVASSGYTLAADAGSFTYTGQTATLRVARKLVAGAGAFSFTGQTATLRVARKIGAAAGAYTLAGADAGLIYSGSGARLTAEAGSYGLTGAAATLRVARRLAAASGSYVFSGGAATLTYSGEAVSVTVGDVLTVPAQDRVWYLGRQSRDVTVH